MLYIPTLGQETLATAKPAIVCLAVMLYIRYPLSLRSVEDFLQRYRPLWAEQIRAKVCGRNRIPHESLFLAVYSFGSLFA